MMGEHGIQNQIRNELARDGDNYLFRANVGKGWAGSGKPVTTTRPITVNLNPGDVLLRSARRFDTGLPPGFSDTFGFVPVVITPDMVGQTVAVFLAIEVKDSDGRVREEQSTFVDVVKKNGGRAGVARDVETARKIKNGGGNESRGVRAEVGTAGKPRA